MRFLRPLTALIASVALLSAACSSNSASGEASPVSIKGDTQSPASSAATEATSDWPLSGVVHTVGGASLNTGDYAGTDLVLWFWAPW